jgi:VanZ family protein
VITDVLLEYKWLAPAVLLVMVLIGPILGARVARHPRLAWLLTGISLLPVVALTLVPVQRELYGFCIVQWSLPTFGRVELLANVVLFVAPVLFAGIASRRPMAMLVAGSALSVLVEIFQALVPAIGRSCDTTDWLSNTIGALIGSLLAIIALRVTKRQQQL